MALVGRTLSVEEVSWADGLERHFQQLDDAMADVVCRRIDSRRAQETFEA